METAMVALVISMGLSFIGMAVAVVFDKSRLIGFFIWRVWRLEGRPLCYVL